MKLLKTVQFTFIVGLFVSTCSVNVLAQEVAADSILKIVYSPVHDSIKSTACFQLGELVYSSDSVAEIYFDKVERFATKKNNDHLRFIEKIMRSRYAGRRGFSRQSLQFSKEAQLLDNETQFAKVRVKMFAQLAYVYTALGNYKKTYANYLKALNIAKESNDIENESGIRFNIGNMYSKQGLNEEALKIFNGLLNDSLRTPKNLLSGVYMMLGNVYWGMDAHEKASKAWNEAIERSFISNHSVQIWRRADCFKTI